MVLLFGKIVVIIHGWPGSVWEFYEVIPLLANQESMPDVVYEIVIPSLPGYGWSDAPRRPGMASAQVGNIFKELMVRLGHEQFILQGADWGNVIGSMMSIFHQKNILAFHSNMCSNKGKLALLQTLAALYFPSWFLEDSIVNKYADLISSVVEESGYLHIQATKPDCIGMALTDSPTGLAAYILQKFSSFSDRSWRYLPDGGLSNFDQDLLLDNIMIYWFTNSITTSMRLYAEGFSAEFRKYQLDEVPVSVLMGCARFDQDLIYTPHSTIQSKYTNLVHNTYYSKGGHFASIDSTQTFTDDINIFVKTVLSKKTDQN